MFMPSWGSIPFWLIYGVLYTSGSDARWHECGHGTAFKTLYLNKFFYQLACFMIMRNPVTWKWSHARHHTDTLLVGRDAEIAVMMPPAALRLILNFVGLPDILDSLKRMASHIFGRLHPDEALICSRTCPAAYICCRQNLVDNLSAYHRFSSAIAIFYPSALDRRPTHLWSMAF